MRSFLLYLTLLVAILLLCYAVSRSPRGAESRSTAADQSREQVVEAQGRILAQPEKTPSPESEQVHEIQKKTPVPREGAAQTGYYDKLIGLTGSRLKQALHERIRRHRVLTYGELWHALMDLDAASEGRVMLIYARIPRDADMHGGNAGNWNREHLWPRAYGITRSSPANTDLHHIRASDVKTNADRGHLYFDETEVDTSAGMTFSFDHDSWEPPLAVKGDIARAMFYMAVRYEGAEPQEPDLELAETADISKRHLGKLSALLDWHRLDPVSPAEKARNQKIFLNYQGNRNPFIDHPEFVNRIFSAQN